MQEKTDNQRIDDLIAHIDAFMTKGGGHMKITGTDGDEVKESFCTACCGETSDNACNTPVKHKPE